MSATSGLFAEEIGVIARRNPYDAGQRALWHLDSIGSVIDCRFSHLSEDLDLVYATPQRPILSGSCEDDLASNSSRPMSESQSRYLRVGEKTRVKFFTPVAVAVFSLDLSPSMNVVDTSFKSVTTGCHLVDSLLRALELSFKALINGTTSLFQPKILVTVIAHGVPSLGAFPLIVGSTLDACCIPEIIQRVSIKLREVIKRLCQWLQAHHESEQLAGSTNCSRNRNPCTSIVCQANDVSTIVRDCLTAISLTCSQFGLSKAGVCKSILIVTDGVLAHPRKLPYDNVLMHMNFVDVTLHIIQIGGGFAPWSALGYASDPDLLRLLAASTPMGLFLQEHHIESTKPGNALWVACTCKLSSMTKRGHTPYKAASYQSSLLVGGWRFPTYVNHVVAEARLGRKEFSLQLQGIEEQACTSSVGSWSPILRNRVSSSDSLRALQEEDDGSDSSPEDNNGGGKPMSLKAYLKPEKAKARPYLYKQYKLPNVSAAQLVQIRVREGFVVDSKPQDATKSSSSIPRLARTSSSGALGGPVTEQASSITLSIHWAAVVDIIYEISVESESSQQVLVKIYLRMPSGEFFLRFKQQLSSTVANQESSTHLYQMCRQLDGFIDTMFSVDDCLAKISNVVATQDVAVWHRWFTVRNLFCILNADVHTPLRLRHGAVESLLAGSRTALLEGLRRLPQVSELGGQRFLIESLEYLSGNNHVYNILARTNEGVLTRAGDASGGPRKSPSVVIDVPPESADGSYTIGVVRINLGFFATSPSMERKFIDSLSNHLKTAAILVDSPSPIIRAVQAGLTRTAVVSKKQQQKRKTFVASPVGMGGESFFTFDPDLEAVNRYMRFHAWECPCPPAALASDVITTIHERRIKEGWKCVYESNNSAIYLIIEPRGPVDTTSPSPTASPAPEPTESKLVSIDWEKLIKVPSKQATLSRNSIRGVCSCLVVQHVQARGEKPALRCRLWSDMANARWNAHSQFVEFCEQLCSHDKIETE